MTIILDKDFNYLMLDTKNKGYLAENFTYLINKLIDFVDPATIDPTTGLGRHKKYPEIVGGKRRIVRAKRGEQLGYQYKTEADTATVTSKGTKTIQAFGQNVLVEEWEVSHPHVKDSDLGETYPTQNPNGEARGPYSCLITARISLSKRTPTRCYVQCNCKDFDTTFYEELNKDGYTNPKSLPASTGKKALVPAICKHLYAIYSKYYTDLVTETEGYQINQSPILFGNQPPAQAITPPTPPTPPSSAVQKVVAITQQDAIVLILARLKQEHARLKNDQDAYLDTRSKRYGGGRHRLYPFSVVLYNGRFSAIAYRNRSKSDPQYRNNAPLQLLVIPNNPKIWQFFTKLADHTKLWDMIRSLGEMPQKMNNQIRKETGVGVYMEDAEISMTDVSYLIEAKNSSILSSISELS